MKEKKLTQDEMLEFARAYKNSGLSIKEFTDIEDINSYQLHYILKKFKMRPIDDREKQFIEVKMDRQITNSIPIKLMYEKLSIEISDNFNEDLLLKLLKVVDQVV